MAYKKSKDEFLKMLPSKLKPKFNFIKKMDDAFFGDEKPLKANKIYGIKTSKDNIKFIPKKYDIVNKDLNYDFILDGYKFRFIISGLTSIRKGDANSTAMQEKTSLYICECVYTNKTIEPSELINIYPDLPNRPDWAKSFKAQEEVFKKIKAKYKNKPTVFNRDGGFMEFITDLVKDLGVSQKDTWNPADIWIHTKNIEKHFEDVQSIYDLNDRLKKLFWSGDLMGISLKMTKDKAKFEEVNLTKIKKTTNEFLKANLFLDLKSNANEFKNDELSFDLTHPEGTINAQVRQFPKRAKANVQISYKIKGSKAEFGKVVASLRNKIYHMITKADFPKGKDMPLDAKTFFDQSNTYKTMINKILNDKDIITNISSYKEFEQNINRIYLENDTKYISTSLVTKLQGVYIAYEFAKLKKSDLDELTTEWSYISQKKGDLFGCFIKIY